MVGLLGGLSLATDLGTGAPLEESLRRSVLAARLAKVAGLPDDDVRATLYTALLQHLGCTAYAHEGAKNFGDDVVTTRVTLLTEPGSTTDLVRTWVPRLAEATGQRRSSLLLRTLEHARSMDAVAPTATCDVIRQAARRLGLPAQVQLGLAQVLTAWNGTGFPRLRGEEICLPARLVAVASAAVMYAGADGTGVEAAVAEVDRRAGRVLDPDLAAAFHARANDLMHGLDGDAYHLVLDGEPDPVLLVDDRTLEQTARTFGDLADLKSPRFHGHSGAVAALACGAARSMGLADEDTTMRLAGHLHDVGRVAVSSRIWDKQTALSTAEQDQAALHAYHSERVLGRIPELAAVALLAGQHHERSDGSGYHRGLTAPQLSLASRVLAAADAYQSLREDEPGRPALPPRVAAEGLGAEARAGRLDPDAVAAVLRVAGHPQATRPPRPGALTGRQVEVLRLLAAGLSNPQIGHRLGISRRTAEHHVQDIYQHIGCSTRAGAALFAMEHGLFRPDG
ncbi:HD domain-containing protein [Knoellia sp. 3-2P3]|uniref:HD domain-containing phosphohydrolase n=1 Tax=unclassified Knoellia TaxID=2618719 RepID=UPI0023DA2B45|nr:HD domain-containing phosphohydrolase [Knoellia sp. 3-2P3]MDF2091877.1 HD domain-containing protein [Knoellia sp. 3-2P3]